MIKNRVKNEHGMVLAMVMMVMMVIAILGVMAINTSNIDIQIFGHQKRSTEAFEVAQAGVDVAIPVIENTIMNGNVPDFSLLPAIVLHDDVANEVLGVEVSVDAVDNDPDIVVTMTDGTEARADIDRLFSQAVAGGSMEFAGGYEGSGASAAGGGTAILYRIRSEGFR